MPGCTPFNHWVINDTDHYANPLEIDLEENLDVTAVFNAQPPTIHNLDARDFEPYVVIFSMRLRDGGGHAHLARCDAGHVHNRRAAPRSGRGRI